MALMQAAFLVAALAGQGTSQVYPLDEVVPGGTIQLSEQFIPIRSLFPDALEFGRKLGEEDWEVLRVRIHVHRPMTTSSFTPQELAGLARLGGEVATVPASIRWNGEELKAWEVEYAEGDEEPIGMFGMLAYIHLPGRWVQILVSAPSIYEDEVRTETNAVIPGFRTGGAFGMAGDPEIPVLASLLNVVGGLLTLIGWIIVVVAMFRDGHTLWGVVSLIFCCSLATLIYSIMNRDRLGAAMWLHIVGLGLSFAAVGVVIVKIASAAS